MKRLFIFLALILGFFSVNAQTWQKVAGYWEYKFLRIDGTLGTFTPPQDTLTTAPAGSIAVKNDVVYYKHTNGSWVSLVGLSVNMATADLTANGDYSHNWNNKQLVIDSVRQYSLVSRGQQFSRWKRVNVSLNPTTANPLSLLSVTRNAANTADSLLVGINVGANDFLTISSAIAGAQSATVLLSNGQVSGAKSKISLMADTLRFLMIGQPLADSVVAIGPYDPVTKTNPIYKIPYSVGVNTNIANGALTADDNYTQDWNHKRLRFDNISNWRLESNETDQAFGIRKVHHIFTVVPSVTTPLVLTTSVRDAADANDSVTVGLRNYYKNPNHYTGLYAQTPTDTGIVEVGAFDAKIAARDSVEIKANEVQVIGQARAKSYSADSTRFISPANAGYPVAVFGPDGKVYSRNTRSVYSYPALGLAASANVTNYTPGKVDSIFYKFSSTGYGSGSGVDFGGWLTSNLTGDSIKLTTPIWVSIGNSITEGHPGTHGRLHPSIDLTKDDVPGQITYYLRQLTKMRWFNHGIGGQTSSQIWARWARDVLAQNVGGVQTLPYKPQGITIECGINDFYAGISVATLKQNLLKMAASCAREGIYCVVLTVPGDEVNNYTQNKQVDEINDWLRKGALNKYGVVIVDFNKWWQDGAYKDNAHGNSTLVDDIHMSAAGYDSLANYIYRVAKLPVLQSMTVYTQLSPDGFTGYSRPANVTIGGAAYTIGSDSAVLVPTAALADTAWFKINTTTNITGTSYTGISHVDYNISYPEGNNRFTEGKTAAEQTLYPYLTTKNGFIGVQTENPTTPFETTVGISRTDPAPVGPELRTYHNLAGAQSNNGHTVKGAFYITLPDGVDQTFLRMELDVADAATGPSKIIIGWGNHVGSVHFTGHMEYYPTTVKIFGKGTFNDPGYIMIGDSSTNWDYATMKINSVSLWAGFFLSKYASYDTIRPRFTTQPLNFYNSIAPTVEFTISSINRYAIGTPGAGTVTGMPGIGALTSEKVVVIDTITRQWKTTSVPISTPTLQSVTTAGNTTTNDIIIGSRTSSVGRFSVEKTFTSLNVHAFDDYSILNPSSSGPGFGVFDASTRLIGSQTTDHLIGFQSRTSVEDGANVDDDYGLTGLLVFNHHIGTGTVTNAHGVYIKEIDGSGPITNQYGLRIAPVIHGTNNFSIRSEGGKSSFVGEVMIGGHTTPIAQLDVRSSTQDQTMYVDNTKPGGYAAVFNSTNAAGNSGALHITASGAGGGGGNRGLTFATSSMGVTDWNYYAHNDARFYNKGRVLIGDTADTGHKLQVNGDIYVSGYIRYNTGILVNNSNYSYISNWGGSAGRIGFGFDFTNTPSASNTVFDIYQGPAIAPSTLFDFKHTHNNSSGNSTAYDIIGVTTAINQTGGSNGIIRGIHYNPTITSLNGEHRAIETETGNVYFKNGTVFIDTMANTTAPAYLVCQEAGSDELKKTVYPILKGSVTWTPGTVAAGSSATTTVSVTGAALGDPVVVSKLSGAYSNGEVYDGFVSSPGTVTVRVHNVSTGSANYSTSETIRFIVNKY